MLNLFDFSNIHLETNLISDFFVWKLLIIMSAVEMKLKSSNKFKKVSIFRDYTINAYTMKPNWYRCIGFGLCEISVTPAYTLSQSSSV